MGKFILNGVEYTGGENFHEYSTNERIVGRWIDGSTVYEKTYSVNYTQSGSWTNTGISKGNINKIIHHELIDSYGQNHVGSIGWDSGYLVTMTNLGSNTINFVIIRYTKTTD